MADDPSALGPSEAQLQAQKLAQEIDKAAADLETNGAVSSAELRRRLLDLEAEWTARNSAEPGRGKTRYLPR